MSTELRLLSLRQPWAWLLVRGFKDIENRPWPTRYRGEIAIHASRTLDSEYAAGRLLLPVDIPLPPPDDLPRGAIVGLCEITACVTRSPSPWFTGPYGFVIANARPIAPIPWRGSLGLLPLPAEIAEHVRAQAPRQRV